MSSSDQAKSKLLNSMRMSKQGSGSSVPEADVPEAEKAEPAKKAASKPAAKAAGKAASTAKKTKKPAAESSAAKRPDVKKPVTDNFQAAQRVWPD